jgi:hypothetical protein
LIVAIGRIFVAAFTGSHLGCGLDDRSRSWTRSTIKKSGCGINPAFLLSTLHVNLASLFYLLGPTLSGKLSRVMPSFLSSSVNLRI